jgi:ankyrin repeat protein
VIDTISDLLDAVSGGDIGTVRDILARDPSAAGRHGWLIGTTPLIVAAQRGFAPIVEVLISAGVDLDDAEDVSGARAVHWAAEAGQSAVLELLLDAGASIDIADRWYGLTALGWANVVSWNTESHRDREAATRVLLERGATWDPFTAVVRNDVGALRTLVAENPHRLEAALGPVGRGQRVLHFAITRESDDFVSRLIDLGADRRACNGWGVTPLGTAFAHGRVKSVNALLSAGTEPDSSSVVFGDARSVSEKFEAANILHYAALVGRAEAVAAALSAGADPTVTVMDIFDEALQPLTPLCIAAIHGHRAAAKKLIEADPALVNAAPNVSPLVCAVISGHAEIVRDLLRAGAQPDAVDPTHGGTALHIAARAGDLDCVRVLVEAGADRAARDRAFGATPSGWATHGGHIHVAAFLDIGPVASIANDLTQ